MIKTFEEAGELILGTRFKKLGDKFLDDVSLIYKKLGIDFETSWFAIFFTLDKYGRLTMSEIASNLGVTQSAISQITSVLEKRGLVKIEIAYKDKRIKVISLTQEGLTLLSRIKPIWKLIKKHMKIMLEEGTNSKYMLKALSELETSFSQKSLTKRVLDDIKDSDLRIEKYKKQYFKEMKRLLFSWIFEYGLPRCDFISNLEKMLEDSQTYLSFSNEHIAAAAIILKNKNKNEMFIINKNDFEDGSCTFLLKNILKEQQNAPIDIYIDKKKANIKKIVEKFGYTYVKTVKLSNDSRELSLFEVKNG